MARPLHSEYGPDTPKKQVARAKSGGVKSARDVWDYQSPQGPTSLNNRGPGLGGSNYGNSGFQGAKSCPPEGGASGLHGEIVGKGVNRRGR